ncbi:MAG: sodium:proton antiporter [Erythrobacter sp.]|nr:sodium:proton antiporter [Erythrobacter sp.]
MIAAFGIALVGAVALEKRLVRTGLTLPIVYVALGYLMWELPLGLPDFDPTTDGFDAVTLEYVTEFIVIVSLAAAGIAIDRPVSWRNWRQIWPLLMIAMPLTVLAVALLGWWVLGLAPASAILLGAVLAPTDPVLARSVQIGPPGENNRHDVRFSLTVEAGLNDGLAFPFTYLAIAAVGMTSLGGWTLEWFALDVVWRIVAGCAVGYGIGRLGAWYVFDRDGDDTSEDEKMDAPGHSTSEGLVVLGTLLSAYGVAELVEGYGFIAVFVGAVTARQREAANRYHRITHHFIDQVEQIVLVAVLLAFGAMLSSGVLQWLTWPGALVALALVFLVRPLAGLLAEQFTPMPWPGKLAIGFLGVRGFGSIYYLSYGQNSALFPEVQVLWATVSFAILVSILVHGVLSSPVIRWAEKRDAHIHAGQDVDMFALSPDDRDGPDKEHEAEAKS